MNRKGAIIFPILIVLIIISLASAGGLLFLYQKEHTHNIQLQGQLSDLESRQRLTEGKLEESKKIATELQLKLQEAKAQVDSLTTELDQEKTARTDVANQLEQIKSDLEQQRTLRHDLEAKLKGAQEEGKKIKEQIKIIEQQKAELETKIKNMEAGESPVELGTVVVNNEPVVSVVETTKTKAPKKAKKQAAANKLEGKIMVVNKEFNFAVINLGSKDNVKIGDQFTVTRSGKIIGDIKIEKVHESMSAAGFAIELKDVIQENDIIIPKAK